MGYVGGSLTSLFGPATMAATGRACKQMAHRAGDRMVELTTLNTPVQTGNLRTSWYQIPVHRTRHPAGPAWRSGVATDVDYAPHVEYGTGLWGPKHAKYPIVPKEPGGWLRWVDPKTGQEVFSRGVMHPGSPGNHMVEISAVMTEGEFESGELVRDILAGWQRTIEAQAD